jgi:hypothetical protein
MSKPLPMTRPELAIWVLVSVLLWMLADIAPTYHVARAQAAHDCYSFIGLAVLIWALLGRWDAVKEERRDARRSDTTRAAD